MLAMYVSWFQASDCDKGLSGAGEDRSHVDGYHLTVARRIRPTNGCYRTNPSNIRGDTEFYQFTSDQVSLLKGIGDKATHVTDDKKAKPNPQNYLPKSD